MATIYSTDDIFLSSIKALCERKESLERQLSSATKSLSSLTAAYSEFKTLVGDFSGTLEFWAAPNGRVNVGADGYVPPSPPPSPSPSPSPATASAVTESPIAGPDPLTTFEYEFTHDLKVYICYVLNYYPYASLVHRLEAGKYLFSVTAVNRGGPDFSPQATAPWAWKFAAESIAWKIPASLSAKLKHGEDEFKGKHLTDAYMNQLIVLERFAFASVKKEPHGGLYSFTVDTGIPGRAILAAGESMSYAWKGAAAEVKKFAATRADSKGFFN